MGGLSPRVQNGLPTTLSCTPITTLRNWTVAEEWDLKIGDFQGSRFLFSRRIEIWLIRYLGWGMRRSDEILRCKESDIGICRFLIILLEILFLYIYFFLSIWVVYSCRSFFRYKSQSFLPRWRLRGALASMSPRWLTWLRPWSWTRPAIHLFYLSRGKR